MKWSNGEINDIVNQIEDEEETSAWSGYSENNGSFVTIRSASKLEKKLKPGAYTFDIVGMANDHVFQEMESTGDEIVRIPSIEYTQAVDEINQFLLPETKSLYDKYGFLYKRSIFMHGKHGTGKSVITNRIAESVIEKGGIVLYNIHFDYLEIAFDILDSTNPNATVLVIFEEFDGKIRYKEQEETILPILDGGTQRKNVVYLATTNHIENIPARILRPGRFSSVIEVKYPTSECREAFLQHKLGNINVKEIVQKTDNFSIDELKEVVLATKCLAQPLDFIVNKIRNLKAMEDGNTNLELMDTTLPG